MRVFEKVSVDLGGKDFSVPYRRLSLFRDRTDPVYQVENLLENHPKVNLNNYTWKKVNWGRFGGMGADLVRIDKVDPSNDTSEVDVLDYNCKPIHVGDTIKFYMEVGLESDWLVLLVGYDYELIGHTFNPGIHLDKGRNYHTFVTDLVYDPNKQYLHEYEGENHGN